MRARACGVRAALSLLCTRWLLGYPDSTTATTAAAARRPPPAAAAISTATLPTISA